jgi:hypothetical protein
MRNRFAVLIACLAAAASSLLAQTAPAYTPPDPATKKLALDIFRQIIDINSTDSVGSVTAVSKALQQRFLDAGFPASDIFSADPTTVKRISSSATTAPARIRPSSSSATKTSSKPAAKTGPPIPLSSSKRTATTTAAAPRT